tara:strand:- start:393 stop:572 length:180 start_codon:yes stop_codon:yes gene_type:complete
MDLIDKIQQYESGHMSPDEMLIFFQELVDSGMAWNLQGHYGRLAQLLIEHGDIDLPEAN